MKAWLILHNDAVLRAGDEHQARDETEALRAEMKRRLSAPQPALCGCKRHSIDFGDDPHAAHRAFMDRAFGRSQFGEGEGRGIKPDVSRTLSVIGADGSGDDVARDAQRTTGGKTLDDIFAECAR